MNEAQEAYRSALKDRREGIQGSAGADASLPEFKPDFYADSTLLTGEVVKVFKQFEELYPPYGLVEYKGEAVTAIFGQRRPWYVLEHALTGTVNLAYDLARPPIESCPYHEALGNKLFGRALKPQDNNQNGLDTLREVSAPGGLAAPALVVGLLRRLPDMQRIHGGTDDLASLAARSKLLLLPEPLSNPQQLARAFMYSLLPDGAYGNFSFNREEFLPDGIISEYFRLVGQPGRQGFGWSVPLEEFTICREVTVLNRVLGSENDRSNEHTTLYPVGTRLGDIEIHEPTIGCPGRQLAYVLWDKAQEVIIKENLWEAY